MFSVTSTPTPFLQLHLQAVIACREQRLADAAALVAQAEEQRVHVRGTCNDQAFEDLRDLDDLTAGFFEVLTSTGKYYWIPMEAVELIEFRPPERPRDLLWRRAHMIVADGPDGRLAFDGAMLEAIVRDAQLVLHEQMRNSILQVVHR